MGKSEPITLLLPEKGNEAQILFQEKADYSLQFSLEETNTDRCGNDLCFSDATHGILILEDFFLKGAGATGLFVLQSGEAVAANDIYDVYQQLNEFEPGNFLPRAGGGQQGLGDLAQNEQKECLI